MRVLDGNLMKKKVDRRKVLRYLEIPEYEEIIYHDTKRFEIEFAGVIEETEKEQYWMPEKTENIIPINLNEFHSKGPSTQMKELFYYLEKYEWLREIVLKDFFLKYKNIFRNKFDDEDKVDSVISSLSR